MVYSIDLQEGIRLLRKPLHLAAIPRLHHILLKLAEVQSLAGGTESVRLDRICQGQNPRRHSLGTIPLSPLHLSLRPAGWTLGEEIRQKEITSCPRQYFFENLFPSAAERGGGNYDLLYQHSVRKYEDDLEH